VSHAPRSTFRQRIVPDQLGNAIIVSTHGLGTTIVVEISESDGNVAGVRLLHGSAIDHAIQVAAASSGPHPAEHVTGVDGEKLSVWCQVDGRVCFQIGTTFLVLSSAGAARHANNVLGAAGAYDRQGDGR
jgi:hypothetical protein